jgi:hypothetical protein
MYSLEQLQQKNIKQLKEIGWQLNVMPEGDKRCRQNWIDALADVNPPLLQLLEVSPADVQAQESPIIETVEASSAAEDLQAPDSPIESKFCRIVYPRPSQGAIAPAAKTSPGVEVDRVQQPIEEYLDIEELFQLESADCPACGGIDSLYARWSQEYAYGYWNIYCQRCDSTCCTDKLPPCLRSEDNSTDSEDSPGVEIDPVLELPIEAAENSPGVDVDRGVTLSDRFLACYSPPQAQIIHFQSDADGQLSLLNFEIESVSEPPDPDDFESIEEFREDLARWDREHPEELAVSLDSFCEWAPCPDTWYESAEVVEVAPSVAIESSITCNFFIPTFDAWCDRFNRSDEPPDIGIYARLPKPKPPSFPPMAASQARAKCILNAYQTHPKYIPKVSRTHTYCIVAGSSTQPARSPPGGDACLVT